jgi:hypothetical protein
MRRDDVVRGVNVDVFQFVGRMIFNSEMDEGKEAN